MIKFVTAGHTRTHRPEDIDWWQVCKEIQEADPEALTAGIEWKGLDGNPYGIVLWVGEGHHLAARYGYLRKHAAVKVDAWGRPHADPHGGDRYIALCGGEQIELLSATRRHVFEAGSKMRPGVVHKIARRLARELRALNGRDVRIEIRPFNGTEEKA